MITSDQISAQFAASQQAQMAAMQQASLYGQTPAFSPAASSSGALGMMGATEMGASIGMNLAWMRAGFSSGALASSASMLGFPAVLGAEYLMGKERVISDDLNDPTNPFLGFVNEQPGTHQMDIFAFSVGFSYAL